MRIRYRKGLTYVAVGFVDLSQLLLGELPDDFDDAADEAVTFVGIDCGAEQVHELIHGDFTYKSKILCQYEASF